MTWFLQLKLLTFLSFIVGVILSFKNLIDEALNTQLEERIPFLYSTISDVHEHSLPDQSMLINEMAAAAGFPNKLDPLLMQCIQGKTNKSSICKVHFLQE